LSPKSWISSKEIELETDGENRSQKLPDKDRQIKQEKGKHGIVGARDDPNISSYYVHYRVSLCSYPGGLSRSPDGSLAVIFSFFSFDGLAI